VKRTIGRIVHYRLSDGDKDAINARRGETAVHANYVYAGDYLPAMITAVFGGSTGPGSVNLKVFVDGDWDYWATSRPEGDGNGQWTWPPRGVSEGVQNGQWIWAKL